MGPAPDPPRAGGRPTRGALGQAGGTICAAGRDLRLPCPPRTAEETDWARIAELYDLLADVAPGPVVEVNRAVAHGRAFGPDAGLGVLDSLYDGALAQSHLLPTVRGDLLARAGRREEAAAAFREAAALTRNESERKVLLRRADEIS